MYFKKSDLLNALKLAYHECFGPNIVIWLVGEGIKIESRNEYFSNFSKANNSIVVLKKGKSNGNVGNHSHLTGKFGGKTQSECNFKTKQPSFFPVSFLKLSNHDAHLFFDTIEEMDKINVKFDVFAKNDGTFNSQIYGC